MPPATPHDPSAQPAQSSTEAVIGEDARQNPSGIADDIARFGERRDPPNRIELRWGRWTARLEGGLLRAIAAEGVELVRGIEFVARDENWGTLPANARLVERGDQRVLLEGLWRFNGGEVPWSVSYELTHDGVVATGRAEAGGDVLSNRTGFVLLHPLSCAGRQMRVEHPDGSDSSAEFPELIRPNQPAMNIRALSYEPVDGWSMELAFDGDVFEMEDQRNWLDASYKTYCRPQSRPKPYTIRAGEPVEQGVAIRLNGGEGPAISAPASAHAPVAMPSVGLGVPLNAEPPTDAELALLSDASPKFLLAEQPLTEPRADLKEWSAAALRMGADMALDAWSVRPVTNQDRAVPEDFAEAIEQASPAWITVETATQPGGERSVIGLRETLGAEAVGAGTRAFFTELNRERPEHGAFLRWTMNPTVHAMDDTTVMESHETVPWSVRSAAAFADGRPLTVGPETLRMRFNPEQLSPEAPPADGEVPANVDPRHRGLFAAAWTVGHVAGLLHPAVRRVALFEPCGSRGIVYRRERFDQPWFDHDEARQVYPVFHVVSALAQANGRLARPLHSRSPSGVVGIEFATGQGPAWIVANCGETERAIELPAELIAVLGVGTMPDACTRPAGFWDRAAKRVTQPIVLEPLGVAMGWAAG